MHFSLKKNTPYFQTIVDSQKVAKIVEGSHVLFIQFPQIVTSYITVIEYQVRTSTLLPCACIVLCHFIARVDMFYNMFYNMCTHHPCAVPTKITLVLSPYITFVSLPHQSVPSVCLTHQWVKEIEKYTKLLVLEGPTDRAAVMCTIHGSIVCSFCDRDKR